MSLAYASDEAIEREPVEATVSEIGVRDLEQENRRLKAEIVSLRKKLSVYTDPAVDGFYTMEQFLARLTATLRRSYGWRVDYLKATVATPGCQRVQNEDIQKWQLLNQVPDWAVEQIDRLSFDKRTSSRPKPWRPDEISTFIDLVNTHRGVQFADLARMTSERFGRPISEGSVKAQKDRLLKKNKLA